jgi:UPF0716 protein FxsA
MWKISLLMIVVPLVETFVLIEVGSLIGPLPTVLLLLLDGVLGAWLARREGIAVLRQLSEDLKQGLPPARHLMEGALVLVGAVLLITPGFTTDLVGMLLLIPFTRRRIAPLVLRYLAARFQIRGFEEQASSPRPPDASPRDGSGASLFDHPVR